MSKKIIIYTIIIMLGIILPISIDYIEKEIIATTVMCSYNAKEKNLIAVLDTGSNELACSVEDCLERIEDENGHAIKMISTIEETLEKLEYVDYKITSIKISNKKGIAYNFNIIKGIKKAIASGARVVNISYKLTEKNTGSYEKLAKENPDVIFVLSAGNDGNNIDEGFYKFKQKGIENIFVIGACDKTGLNKKEISNFGEVVDYYIFDEYDNEDKSVTIGTSISTARLSGIIAYLQFKYGIKKANEIRKILNEYINNEKFINYRTVYNKIKKNIDKDLKL